MFAPFVSVFSLSLLDGGGGESEPGELGSLSEEGVGDGVCNCTRECCGEETLLVRRGPVSGGGRCGWGVKRGRVLSQAAVQSQAEVVGRHGQCCRRWS